MSNLKKSPETVGEWASHYMNEIHSRAPKVGRPTPDQLDGFLQAWIGLAICAYLSRHGIQIDDELSESGFQAVNKALDAWLDDVRPGRR